jgi:hypothetical protein
MPQIRYQTNDVPAWGMGAFTPVVPPTPLASTGGEQLRLLQQWTDAEDPNVAGMASTAIENLSYQPSYAQVGNSSDFSGQESYGSPYAGRAANGGVTDRTYVPGLPLAFRPVINARHFMAYSTTPQDASGKQTMGPNGSNTHMKIYSDNPLPIPANNPGRVAKPAMRTQPVGTPIATAWPRPFISWPSWGTSRQA